MRKGLFVWRDREPSKGVRELPDVVGFNMVCSTCLTLAPLASVFFQA